MIAVDSSVAVAAFASWHGTHEAARAEIDGARLPAQAAVETYSVLTRLPAPHRAAPSAVVEFLRHGFREPYLVLDGRRSRALVEQLAAAGISGGAAYDALVAAVARAAGATLLSCDRRAAATYERVGVAFRLIA